MLRRLIIDKERDLETENDLLGTKCYANQLADIIQNTSAEQAYTIGLYGRWGSGKSTIIKTAKHKLETENPQRIKVVIYDAWKYSGDSFRRMFLMQLQSSLNLKPTQEMERFYSTRSEELSPSIKLKPWTWWMFAILFLCIVIGLVALKFMPTTEAKLWTAFSMSFASLIVAMFGGGLFYELKVSQTKNILSAPEQFEDCFKHLMDQVFKRNPESSRGELEKLVIVIDNLDRCPTDVVYSMLTDIKSFLTNGQHNVVFVVPIDDGALKKHLFARLNSIARINEADAEEFLRKFFNVVIKIKPHRSDDLLHYIHELNHDQQLGFNPNTLSIIAKEYVENPRCILQVLNNLTVEQSLYDEDFAKKNETLIAACMILREHYPQMIEELLKGGDMLFVESCYEYKQPKPIQEGNQQQSYSVLPKGLDENKNFKAFMRTAKLCLQSADFEDFRLILANTENALVNVSDNIKKALDSYDSDTILSCIRQSPTMRADIFIEIKRRIDFEDQHDATDAMEQWAECIAKINENEPLRPEELREMDAALYYAYDFIPRDIAMTDSICKLAKDMDKIGEAELKNTLLTFVKESSNEQYKQYHNYVRSVLHTFTDKDDCDELHEFAETYMYDSDDITAFTFTDTQKQHLLTDSFVTKVINNVKSTKDEKQQQLLVWCFTNLTGINQNTYNALIKQFANVFGQQNRSLADSMNIINYVLPIIQSIAFVENTKILNQFFKRIMDARTAPYNSTQIYMAATNEESAQVLAHFCFEMYRVSNRHLSINPYLLTIQLKCESYVKKHLVDMKERGADLWPFYKNIIQLRIMDDAWYDLIPVAFDTSHGSNAEFENNMKRLLLMLYNDKSDKRAKKVLRILLKDSAIADLYESLFGSKKL